MNQLLETKIEEFKNYLIANNLKHNTIRQYIPYVRKFLEAIKIENLSQINQSMVFSYLAQEQPKFGQARYNTVLESISQFCELNDDVPKLRFPHQKVAKCKKIKQPITEEELRTLVEPRLAEIFQNVLEVKVILYFLFYTGLRCQEIINLKRKDIDFEKSRVIVWVPKQELYRNVPLPENLLILLKKYFNLIPEEKNAFNLSTGKLKYIMTKIKESEVLGKNRDIWVHLWRDSFACACLNKGMDIFEVQQLLNHSDINTTMKYITVANEKVQKKFLHLVKGIL